MTTKRTKSTKLVKKATTISEACDSKTKRSHSKSSERVLKRVNEMEKSKGVHDYDVPTALRRKKGYKDLDANEFSSERYLPSDERKREMQRDIPTKLRRDKGIDLNPDEIAPSIKKSSMRYDPRTGKHVHRSEFKPTVRESKYFNESTEALDHILKRFPHEVRELQKNGELDYDGPLYDALYDYYLQSGDMPYDVAKGRGGSPYEWVLDKITEYLNDGEDDSDLDVNMDDFSSDDTDIDDLSRLAGLSESKKISECGEVGSTYDSYGDSANGSGRVTISTSYDSQNDYRNVSVSAEGENADALLQILRNAGLLGMSDERTTGQSTSVAVVAPTSDYESGYELAEDKESRNPKYNNTPNEEETDTEAILNQGTDLHRRKKQYAGKPKLGDNPMASESAMPKSFKKIYESIQTRAGSTSKKRSRRK